MEGVPVAGTVMLGTLVWLFIDFLKSITNGDWKPALTQVIAWVSGIAAVFLVSASDFGATSEVAGKVLNDADGPTKLLLGLLVSSLIGGVVKGLRSIDNSDSNAQPPLVPPSG